MRKSENPLSPTVAGPIPGVNITPPSIVQPSGGQRIPVDQQPITLTVENAATSGVRPLSYRIEIAMDADFANVVFAREGIAPGDGGHTTFRLSDALSTGRTYYWRVRAQDGANSGPFTASSFNVFTPIVIQAPGLVAPIGNQTTANGHPRFTIANAARSGPAGAIGYVIEVADSDSFANRVAVWVINETPGQTSVDAPGDLPPDRQLFWRAQAFDPTTVGPFSQTGVFRTPPLIVAPPPGGGGGGGGGGSAVDMMSLASVSVHGGPADATSWPATTAITRIDMSPGLGFSFQFSARSTWPDYTPPGWDGALQYTVWPVVRVNGSWYTAAIVQMWRDRPGTGAFGLSTWRDDFPANWSYIAGGPMAGYHPNPGDQMGFFVTAGNARFQTGVTSLRERSNVVIITLPAGDVGTFPF